MVAGIVFVIHDDADRDYAAQLAAALAPMTAMPVSIAAETPLRFGQGALCVILWGPELAARGGTSILGLLPKTASETALIYCTRGADPGREFGAYGLRVVHASGELEPDSEQLRAAISAVLSAAESAHPNGSRQVRPAADTGDRAVKAVSRSNRLLVRSAFGIAATLGLVAIISQQLGIQRIAGAASQKSEPTPSPAVAHAAEPAPAHESSATVRGASVATSPLRASRDAGEPLLERQLPVLPIVAAPPPDAAGEDATPPAAEAEDLAPSFTTPDAAVAGQISEAPVSTSDDAQLPFTPDKAGVGASEKK